MLFNRVQLYFIKKLCLNRKVLNGVVIIFQLLADAPEVVSSMSCDEKQETCSICKASCAENIGNSSEAGGCFI